MAAPAVAHAQEAPPYDPNVELQLFDYPTGPKSFFAVDDANVAAAKQMSFDLMITFLTNPMTVYNVSANEEEIVNERTEIVQSILAGQIGGAYGIGDKYQIGLAVPVIFSQSGEGVDPNTARPDPIGLQISGLGDLRLEGKARLWEQDAMKLALSAGLTLPSSFGAGGNDYLGDNLPTLRGRAAYQWTAPDNKLSAGANLGVILRKPRTIYVSEVGPAITYGLAASYAVTDRFAVAAETFGRTGMTSMAVDASPMEVEGGLRVRVTKSLAVVLGGGAGVIRGIGSPGMRVFASVGYEPDTRDSDGDGVNNDKDRCPLIVEDFDGFQDRDGCPDDDNDGDHRADGEDQCVDQAEDIDGFDDDDGCPDLDNDGDGIEDLADRYCPLDKEDGQAPQPSDGCPVDMRDTDNDGLKDNADACYDQEEDADEWDDWDGCPEIDNDGDGVADDSDQCPLCMEDKDGAQDEDGCPEIDIDADGIKDEKDQCPTEAEVINSVDDWDGCPDEGGAEVATFDGDRITFKAKLGFDKKGLTRAGTVMLDQAALLMLQHPEVTKWALAVSAKKPADAKKRSEWVVRYLVGKGVAADTLHVLTTKGSDAVALGVEEREEVVEGAPMCPAGMEAQPKSGGPAASPSSTVLEPEPEASPAPEPDVELE